MTVIGPTLWIAVTRTVNSHTLVHCNNWSMGLQIMSVTMLENCKSSATCKKSIVIRNNWPGCTNFIEQLIHKDRLCGPGYRTRGPGSIPGATRFSEKQWVWNGVHSASWVQPRSDLEEKVAAPGLEFRDYGRRDPSRWPRGTLCPQKLALTSPTSGGCTAGIFR
jgi:hypothetical protein